MAFMKKADAGVVHRNWTTNNWQNFIAHHESGLHLPFNTRTAKSHNANLVSQASEILGEDFDPSKYLLTHATIVASVNTEAPKGVKLGSIVENGQKINRRWADYHVTPDTQHLINNNADCWSRPVLLKSYRTFIGAQNFLEHMQIAELSKGRIIDAVARDVGNSIYVDILVATNRKHAELVKDIEDGTMNSMSMGCFLAGTQVTMADGTRVAIEDIAPGDMVLTHMGRAREVVNKQIRHYKGEMRNIKVTGVPSVIRATANHGFHVIRPAFNCACGCEEPLIRRGTKTDNMKRRFKQGHDKNVYNPVNTYSLEEARQRKEKMRQIKDFTFEKVRADELNVGDFVAFPRVKDESGEMRDGWTIGKARLIGYFLAEGSYLKRKGEHVEVQFNFSLSEKDTYVQEVLDLLAQEFPNANKPWAQIREQRNTIAIHLTGREVAEWFYKHCGEYSHGKKISAEVMGLPTEFHKHLIGAWINGDGCGNKANGSLSGTTTSYALACQMHYLLSRCGIYSRMECKVNGRNTEIAQAVGSNWVANPETGKRPYLTVYISGSHQKELGGYTDKIVAESTNIQHLRLLEDYIIFPVDSIEKDWHEGLVYNMEVEEDHTYVVEGVTVYNCSVTYCACTKCGNVAADETEMCAHVKYEKGNVFMDNYGVQRKVAELCGHEELEPTGGVNFIEASWVKTPAFTGAVMRNILQPEVISINTVSKMKDVLSSVPKEWSETDQKKAASFKQALEFPEDPVVESDSGSDSEEAPKGDSDAETDSIQEIENEVEQYILNRIKERLKNKMQQQKQKEVAYGGELEVSNNDTVVRQASHNKRAQTYRTGIATLVHTASNDADLMNRIAQFNEVMNIKVSTDLYRTALKVGSTSKFKSVDKYLLRCAKELGRNPTKGEAKTLVRLGQILAMRK